MDALRPRSNARTGGNRECGKRGSGGAAEALGRAICAQSAVRGRRVRTRSNRTALIAARSGFKSVVGGRCSGVRPPSGSFRVWKPVSGERGSIAGPVRAAESACPSLAPSPRESQARSRDAVPGRGRTRQLSQEEELAKAGNHLQWYAAAGEIASAGGWPAARRPYECSVDDTGAARTAAEAQLSCGPGSGGGGVFADERIRAVGGSAGTGSA